MENRLPWMEDESVKHIEQKKLEFIQKLYNETKGKSQKELVAYIMPMMKIAKKENLTFTPDEMQIAINAIKKYSSKDEIEQINNLLNKVQR